MNSSFSHALNTVQFAWDNTSLSALEKCPRYYKLAIIDGWVPRSESAHLTFGLCYHNALEVYDHKRADGMDHAAATVEAVRACLRSTWSRELNRPWSSDIPEKNRFTLVRTVVWYLDQFKDDPLKTIILANGKPAVELSFRFEVPGMTAPTGEQILLTGHLDRVASMGKDLYIVDRKTSKNSIEGQDYFDKYSPDSQMSQYDFAGRVIYNLPIQGVIIDAAQVLVTLSRFRRGMVPRTDSLRREYFQTTKHFIRQAFTYSEMNWWPMNYQSCGLYGGCVFRKICGKSPEVRDSWLSATFKKRVWDPLKVRGDI